MLKDKRKLPHHPTLILKGALQVILGAITGFGVFLTVAVLVGDPEISYADRLDNATCHLLDECDTAALVGSNHDLAP